MPLSELGLPSGVLVWHAALLAVISFLVGILGGFVGLALGTMRLPSMLLLGMPAPAAGGTNILVSSLASLAGTIRHLRAGRVNLRIVLTMGVPAFIGAFIGGWFSDVTPEHLLIALVGALLDMHDLIDLMIPRGGKGLVERVRDEASMPVVAGGIGICHTYVDRSADLAMALEIVDNAKTRRVSICNALDVMILHADVAAPFLASLAERWGERVELRADPASAALLSGTPARVRPAGPDDFDTEFPDMVAGVRVVDAPEAALAHIAAHGSGHSEAIVTRDDALAERFLREVDAATVYVNASTQFTDGGEFGLGAEVGISTGKLHARGPVGLRELTSYKWVVRGTGQTRPR